MNKLTIYFSLIATMAVSVALGQCTVDQPSVDNYVYSDSHMGQSFVACTTGQLESISIHMHSFLQGEREARYHLLLDEGLSGDTVHSALFTMAGGWGERSEIALVDGPTLIDGQTYTVLFDYLGEYGACWVNLTDVYSDGLFYWSGEATPAMDLGFELTMSTTAPSCIEWTSEGDTDWHSADNWSGGLVPSLSDCVLISANEAGVYPTLGTEGYCSDLTVGDGAALYLEESGTLHIGRQIDPSADCLFDGTLVLHNIDGQGQLMDALTARRMKLYGQMMLFSPLVITDLLDLSDGDLLVMGALLTVRQGEDHKGHIYYPEMALAGQVNLSREDIASGVDLLALPLAEIKYEAIKDSLRLEEAHHLQPTDDPFSNDARPQQNLVDGDITHDLSRAILTDGLSGTSTSRGPLQSGESLSTGLSDGQWRAVANPYASILDWTKVQRSTGVSSALHQWDEAKRQFASIVDGLATHGATTSIAPMSALMIRIPEGEEVRIDYADAVITPEEIYEEVTPDANARPMILLQLQTPEGTDEAIVAVKVGAHSDALNDEDAWKLPSLDPTANALASIATDGTPLAINQLPEESTDRGIPLLVLVRETGKISMRASLIEHFARMDDIYLEDRALDRFHNLFEEGDYVTTLEEGISTDRFFLHLRGESDPSDPLAGLDTTLDTDPIDPPTAGEAPKAQLVGNEVIIDTGTPRATPITGHLRIHDMSGRLVFSTTIALDGRIVNHHLPLRSACYMLHIESSEGLVEQKIFVE